MGEGDEESLEVRSQSLSEISKLLILREVRNGIAEGLKAVDILSNPTPSITPFHLQSHQLSSANAIVVYWTETSHQGCSKYLPRPCHP
jgi:hypothetical protein